MTIGQRIRTCRHKACLSQQDLAEKVGVSLNMVSRWEHGVEPGVKYCRALAAIFDVSLDWLIDGRGEGPSAAAESPAATGTEG